MVTAGDEYHTYFSTLERGIVLPLGLYMQFANMLSLATNGVSFCDVKSGAYCLLPENCSSYSSLWNYSFNMNLQNDQDVASDFLIVPLATFASDYNEKCRIFVEYKENNFAGKST
jgi:hypothetical protein